MLTLDAESGDLAGGWLSVLSTSWEYWRGDMEVRHCHWQGVVCLIGTQQ